MNCLHCGAPVQENGICSNCGLNQSYLVRAWNTSQYYYNQGLSDAKIRNLTGAEEALKASLRYNKANIDARNLLGLVYYETGQIFEALAQWVISSNYEPEQNIATRYLAVVQGNQNKLAAYDQAAKKYNLTLHYVRQHNHDLALIQLKKVISDNPHFIKAYLILALIYLQDGNVDKAKRALQRVLKIDKYNKQAQYYLDEIVKNGSKYENGTYKDADYSDDFLREEEDDPDSEEELDEEESARRKIREIIERGAAAEDINPDSNLEVGSYREIKYGKHNVLYLLAGLAIGVIAMFLLIMPASIRSVQNRDLELKSSYSAELSGKNVQIAGLQEETRQLEDQLEALKAELNEAKALATESTLDESLLSGIESYLNGDKEAAIQALGNIDLQSEGLTDKAKECIQGVIAGCEEELGAYRSAGITAFTAENYDDAVANLSLYCHLKPDDVEARYDLAQAYERKGDIQSANDLYEDINTRFPDSEYTSTIFQ